MDHKIIHTLTWRTKKPQKSHTFLLKTAISKIVRKHQRIRKKGLSILVLCGGFTTRKGVSVGKSGN